MKEYTITIKMSIEAEESDYEKVERYAQDIADSLVNDDIVIDDDIEITEAEVCEIEDLNDYTNYDSIDDDDDENN